MGVAHALKIIAHGVGSYRRLCYLGAVTVTRAGRSTRSAME
jgi:hypothetical protein